ncbi:MAG: DUF2029 domain-containing protein [Phycisphaerales bacterium]|nr:DUF2029 domain-containing protein [Phycisphaerales bacterium]
MSKKSSRATKTILTIAVLVVGIVTLAIAAYRARHDQSSTSDFDDFWLTGRHFLNTGEMTEDYGVHNYLPFFLLFFAPFSVLPLKVSSVVFNLIALTGFAFSVRVTDGLLAESNHPNSSAPNSFLRRAAPVLMCSAYVIGTVIMGQMALMTLAMLVFAWRCAEKKQDLTAGFWLALAISTKVYPATLVPFFFLKRKWRLLAGTLVSSVLMNVVAVGLAFGSQETKRLYGEFWTRSVQGQSGLRLAVIKSDKMSYTNQSSSLLARRYTCPTDSGVDTSPGRPRHINIVNWDDSLVGFGSIRFTRSQWLLLAYYAVILGPTLWICRHSWETCPRLRLQCEFAAFILLALLLSPIVWSFYYTLCYFPLALLNWKGLTQWRQGKRLTSTLVIAVFWWLGLVAIAVPLIRMGGYHWACCLALFALMLAYAVRHPPRNTGEPKSTEMKNGEPSKT